MSGGKIALRERRFLRASRNITISCVQYLILLLLEFNSLPARVCGKDAVRYFCSHLQCKHFRDTWSWDQVSLPRIIGSRYKDKLGLG